MAPHTSTARHSYTVRQTTRTRTRAVTVLISKMQYFFFQKLTETAPLFCISVDVDRKNKEIYQWQVFLVHRLCHVPAHASRIRVYRSVVGAEVLCLRLAEFTSSDFRTYFPLFISLSLFSPLFSSLTYLLICRRCSTCFWLHCRPPLPSPALYGWRLTRPLSPSLWVSTLRLGPWRKRKQILSLARWYELISHLPVYCFYQNCKCEINI